MHSDTAAGRKQKLLMRSAQERVDLVEALTAVGDNVSIGVDSARNSVNGAVRKAGVLGIATVAATLGVRLLAGLLSRSSKSSFPGGWVFALGRQLFPVLVLPLLKQYGTKWLAGVLLPRPQPAPADPPAGQPPVSVRESSSFLSRFSLSRIFSDLLKL